MKILNTLIAAGCAAMIFAGAAHAQTASSTPANKEYMAAMEKMDKKMMDATDPDPTKSFAKKMIAHHEGSIEMSQIVQKYTKDEKILKMAKKMIPEQQKDIKELNDWIAKH